jgi:hypothetical protein
MNCGHAHADALSIELTVLGCPLLIDPGTYTYTGSAVERDRFRHSAAHNTVTVDGAASSVPAGPFSWASRADARVDEWWTGTLVDAFVGSHPGFARLPDPVLHRRHVLFVKDGYWIVVDSVLTEGMHESAAHYHAAVGSVVTPLTPTSAYVDAPCLDGRRRLLLGVAGDVDALEWGEDWVSSAYGSRALAPVAHVISRGMGRRDLLTALVPVVPGRTVSLTAVPCRGGFGFGVDRPGAHDLLLFRRAGAVSTGSILMEADAALVRRAFAGGPITDVALFGPNARLLVGGLVFEARGAAELRRGPEGWIVAGAGGVGAR